MKKVKILMQIFLLLIIFNTCQKEETATKAYPRLNTLAVSEINESGAKFSAEIISGDRSKIIEYGFVWNYYPDLDVDEHDKLVIQGAAKDRVFSGNIHSALKKGETYYMKPYVKTNEYLVYGKMVSFVSLGSEAPVITDFEKKTGTWGDTINISGKNFRYNKGGIEAKLGNVYTTVISSTDTTLKVIIPYEKNSEKANFTVSIMGNSSVSSSQFTYIIPQITSIIPLTATFSDTIYIHGINFFNNYTYSKVYFDGIQATNIFVSPTLIKAIVPVTLVANQSKIKVAGPTGDIEFGTSFILKDMVLKSFEPDTAFVADQIITIKGENFNPLSLNSKVTIKGIDAPIIESSSQQIKVRIPASLIPVSDISFITTGEISVISSQRNSKFVNNLELYIKRRWTRMKDFPGTARELSIGFSIGEKGYIGMGYSGNNAGPYYNDFWEYDPKTDQWTQKADFPGTTRVYQSSYALAGEGYVGLGSTSSDLNQESFLKDFYKYNPGNDSWSRIADYPGKARARAVVFLKNGIAYVGTGRSKYDGSSMSYWENIRNDDFWSWNSTLGQWNTALNHPYRTQDAYGFNIGDSGFTFESSFYEFGGSSWLNRYNTHGYYAGNKVTFSVGNLGYIFYYDGFLIFNNLNGQVSTKYLSQEVLFYPYLPAVFVINNKVYMICGGRNSITRNVWEFDPSK